MRHSLTLAAGAGATKMTTRFAEAAWSLIRWKQQPFSEAIDGSMQPWRCYRVGTWWPAWP